MRSLVAALVMAFTLASPAWAGPFEDGMDAYDKKDFATAMQLWRPSADRGHAEAQYGLSIMYAKGHGVPQDYVMAYMWLNLSAGGASDADTREQAQKGREAIATRMTPAQIAEAQRLSREWKPTGAR